MTKSKKQKCVICKKDKMLQSFYVSSNELFSITGRVPICKECMVNSCLDEDGEIILQKFHDVLKKVDRPFIFNLWQSSLDEAKLTGASNSTVSVSALKLYWKNINSLRQYKYLTYEDSEVQNEASELPENVDKNIKDLKKKMDDNKVISITTGDFSITDEIIELFGEGYTKAVYKKMYDKYEKLKLNYSLQTNLHQEALVTYVRFKVQEEMATAIGKIEDAKKWYDAAQTAAEKAKLTPKQLTQADLQGGVNSFSEIFRAVEQATDVISILPEFKFKPNDALDFNIWCYINYARDLQGLPHCEYKDVYTFYDKKKSEYIEQYGDPYGIFDEDPCENLRPNIEKFITLPKNYYDSDGDE